MTIGQKMRELREHNELPLRKVSAFLDVDVAILSKIERGERKISKDIVEKLAELYNYDKKELLILFLSDKILSEIIDEEHSLEALKVAEKKMKYLKNDESTK